MYFFVVVLCFLQVLRSSNYACRGKKGRRFQLCHQFLAVFLLSQDNYCKVPNKLVHRAGPPFLDNHYRGYQLG